MVLLIRARLDAKVLELMITQVFEHRGTHPVPVSLAFPPGGWEEAYTKLAKECAIDLSMTEAYADVKRFFSGLVFH